MRSRCMTKFDFAKHFRYLFLANLDGIDFGMFDFRIFEQFCSAFGLFVSCFFFLGAMWSSRWYLVLSGMNNRLVCMFFFLFKWAFCFRAVVANEANGRGERVQKWGKHETY